MNQIVVAPEVLERFHELAEATHRNEAEIINEALIGYLRFEAARIAKIQSGMAQADRGEFLDDAAEDAFFARYGGSD